MVRHRQHVYYVPLSSRRKKLHLASDMGTSPISSRKTYPLVPIQLVRALRYSIPSPFSPSRSSTSPAAHSNPSSPQGQKIVPDDVPVSFWGFWRRSLPVPVSPQKAPWHWSATRIASKLVARSVLFCFKPFGHRMTGRLTTHGFYEKYCFPCTVANRHCLDIDMLLTCGV